MTKEVFEDKEIAIREVTHGPSRGSWQVIRCNHTRTGREWVFLMTLDAGLPEESARAWAFWWEKAIAEHGLEGARAIFPAELEKSRRMILASLFEVSPADMVAAVDRNAERRRALADFDELRSLRALEEGR